MPDPSTAPIHLAIADGLATLTLARPDAGNAMDWALIDGFAGACGTIAAAKGVRAILLLGEGRNFCVGGDIKVFADEPDPAGYIERLARRLHEGVETLAGLAAPVIAGVQGAAAGAGLSLVAGADLVIAGRTASFTMAYSAIGLSADGGATWLLPRLIGLRRAQEMAYTNRRIGAEEAERIGLVGRVVDDMAVAGEATSLARRIAEGPTAAFARLKRLFGAAPGATFPQQLDAEARAIGETMATADARNAIAAFLARRPATFTGG